MRRFVSAAWILFALLSLLAYTQPVTARTPQTGQAAGAFFPIRPASFTTPGKVNTSIPLGDGRVLLGGSFVSIGGQAAPGSLAMIKNDGSLDTTFRVDPDLQVYEVYAAALQSDGKIVIAGWFKKLPVYLTHFLLRLEPNGTLDDTFAPTAINSQVYSILVDGEKILVGGDFTQPAPRIARLNQDGTADPSFSGVGTGANSSVRGIARQSSGKYIIVGEFSSYNGASQAGVARLSASGSLDAAFVPGGYRAGRRVAVLNDNSVVVGGEDICGEVGVFAWYTAEGAIKAALSPDPDLLQSITALLPLPDGGFLMGGWYTVGCFGSPLGHEAQVWRYGSDGSYRTMASFGDESDVLTLALRSDGKVLLGGQGRPGTSNEVGVLDGLSLLDLSNNGLETVPTFHPLVGDEAEIYSLSRYPDGKLLAAGNFSHVDGSPRFGLARLLANGGLDPGYSPFADTPGGWSSATLALPDGRGVASFGDSNLFLIGQDGNRTDLSAVIGYDRVSSLALQEDGKVLVGSDFGLGVRRLKADFSGVDDTFIPGDAYGAVYALAVQEDSKILVAGNFTRYNNTDVPGLVRLNNDGSLDGSFAPPPFMLDENNTATLYNVTPLSGGAVWVGGNFATVGGEEHLALVRLNSSGALDTNFTSPAGFHTVKTICVQGDGSIWTGGKDSSVFRNPRVSHFAETGQIDSVFQSVYQAAHNEGGVNAVLCDTDGMTWAGGRVSIIDGRSFYGLARYFPLWGQVFLPLIKR